MAKIIVTGGAGFIGSHIVDKFLTSGYSVAVVDDLSTGKEANLNPQAKLYKASITDRHQLAQIFQQEKPEIICHQAAQVSVRNSVKDPIFDAQNNILGTINLLELARQHQVKKFIFASTGGAIYGEAKEIPTPEGYPENPVSPYGVSKLAGEKYLQFYYQQYQLPYVILRYSNVYGPRQDPHGEAGVVAIFSANLWANKPCIINGDGQQTRDFIYVEDVAEANLKALEYPEAEVFNIATGKETSINELFQLMAKVYQELSGKQPPSPQHGPPKPGEQRRSCLKIAKAQAKLGWQPTVELQEGLKKTLASFQPR